jgi:hypothetical protein
MRALFLLTWLVLASGIAYADGSDFPVPYQLAIDSKLIAYNDAIFDQGAAGLRIVAELHNTSGRAWQALHIDPEINGNDLRMPGSPEVQLRVYYPETISPAVWRSRATLRINGVYMGLAGGDWDLIHDPSNHRLTVDFGTHHVRSGDTLVLQFDAAALGSAIFRLRHEAIPAPGNHLRNSVPLALVIAGCVGFGVLFWMRNQRSANA